LPEAEASTIKGNVVVDSPFREVPFPPPLVLSSPMDHRWYETGISQSRYEEMENKNITVAMDPIKQCHDDGGNNGRCGEILGEENRCDAEGRRTEGKERQRLRRDPFTSDEIYSMIRTIQDPEHNLTLEQLSIVNVDHIDIYDSITTILDNNDNEKNNDNDMHVDEKKISNNDKDDRNSDDGGGEVIVSVEMEEKKEENNSCCGGKIVENENVNEKEEGGCCGGKKSNEVNTKESEIERRRLERRRGGFSFVDVRFTPTIPHCSFATLIGFCIRVKLLRSLPSRFKVEVRINPGSHSSEGAVNQQLADKERLSAALENEKLLGVVNKCIVDGMML